ncbi:hypothetical protein BG011_010125, partial [Mortierella polycephala]
LSTTTTASQNTITVTMPFFKRSSKNKISSAASTPSQTPPTSTHGKSSNQANKMTLDQALEAVMGMSASNASSGPFIH